MIKLKRVSKVWLFYFLVKVFYPFFAHYVYSDFSQLGDTDRYYHAPLKYSFHFFYNSTNFMETIGGGLLFIFREEVIASLFISILVYICTYKSLSLLNLSKRDLKLTLLILSLPSIAMWTSIWSKESMMFLSFCLISPFLIKCYADFNLKYNKFYFFLGCYFLFLMKPQFFLSIFSLLGYFILIKKTRNGPFFRLLLIVSVLSFLAYMYYVFRVEIYELTSKMKIYFVTNDLSSTRDYLTIFDHQDSFLFNIPYGFYLSFFGPTIDEVINRNVFAFFYIESWIIFSFLFYLYSGVVADGKLRVDFLYVICVCLFLIMLVDYPFGVYNPGSAIRYRADFIYYIIFIGLLLKKRSNLRI